MKHRGWISAGSRKSFDFENWMLSVIMCCNHFRRAGVEHNHKDDTLTNSQRYCHLLHLLHCYCDTIVTLACPTGTSFDYRRALHQASALPPAAAACSTRRIGRNNSIKTRRRMNLEVANLHTTNKFPFTSSFSDLQVASSLSSSYA